MKSIYILGLLFLSTSIYAQSAPFTIDQKQVGSKIQFYGQNKSTKTIDVTLTLKDYTAENIKGYSEPVTKTLRAKQKLLFLTIELVGPTSYTYETQWIEKSKPGAKQPVASAQAGKRTSPAADTRSKTKSLTMKDVEAKIEELGTRGIVLFDKAGCSRCSRAASFLTDNNIEYVRMDITENGIENAVMWQLLRESGYKKNSLQTPAIMVDGEISHSHKNLTKFLESLLD